MYIPFNRSIFNNSFSDWKTGNVIPSGALAFSTLLIYRASWLPLITSCRHKPPGVVWSHDLRFELYTEVKGEKKQQHWNQIDDLICSHLCFMRFWIERQPVEHWNIVDKHATRIDTPCPTFCLAFVCSTINLVQCNCTIKLPLWSIDYTINQLNIAMRTRIQWFLWEKISQIKYSCNW